MNLMGMPVITSEFLTVPGEPVEVLAPDWRERMERNGNRARAHLYSGVDINPRSGRRAKKYEGFEPLEVRVTPQLPDPNVYRFADRFVCHPATLRALEISIGATQKDLRRSIDDLTMGAMLYGRV
jgi:hypothetical protein